jgi:hypothetical protein
MTRFTTLLSQPHPRSAATKLSQSFYSQAELDLMDSHVLDVDWGDQGGNTGSFPMLGGKRESVHECV